MFFIVELSILVLWWI